MFLIKLKKLISMKTKILFIIKILLSFVTLYHCIVVSVDYLGFQYRYNLIVEDNSKGYDWKPLSVCTESKVLFDKYKVIQYLYLFEKYLKYENAINEQYKVNSRNPRIEILKKYWISKFFVRYGDTIIDGINYAELSSLIVKENNLFECSAKFHYKNQSIDSKAIEIESCFEMFGITTSIIANNTFGNCYEFFKTNLSIVLKENDFIKIKIKFNKQKDFIGNGVYHALNIHPNEFYQYFRWYYFIENYRQNNALKSSLIYSTRIGLSAELKITKTSVIMLSVPYMTYCEHFGCRHEFYKITLDNDYFQYNNDTVLEIKSKMKKQLIYHAEPSLQLVDFISNIGGLFGLYFGLSFIDISQLLKNIGRRIRSFLQNLIFYRKMKRLIEYLKLSQMVILKYIKRITKIPWKSILTLISSPFFISKIFDLIINYFHFPTQISFEFVEYQQNHQKISTNEFPAITVCTEHMFEKAFFDQYYTFYQESSLYNRNIRSKANNRLCYVKT